MYDAILAGTVTIRGGWRRRDRGLPRPGRIEPGAARRRVVPPHMPGYDARPRRSPATSRLHATTRSCRTSTTARRPGPRRTTPLPAARAQGGVPDARLPGEVAGAAAHLRGADQCQRQNRRHRLLLRRAPVGAGRGQPATGCGGGLLRRHGDRDPAGGLNSVSLFSPQSKHLVKDVSCPLLGPVRHGRRPTPSPEHVAELEQELKAHGKTFEFHSYEGAGPRVLLGQPPVLPPPSRDGRLEPHLHLVRPLPLLVARGRPAQPALEAAQMLMPPSTASRSMAASSSSVKSVRPAAARFSSSWARCSRR